MVIEREEGLCRVAGDRRLSNEFLIFASMPTLIAPVLVWLLVRHWDPFVLAMLVILCFTSASFLYLHWPHAARLVLDRKGLDYETVILGPPPLFRVRRHAFPEQIVRFHFRKALPGDDQTVRLLQCLSFLQPCLLVELHGPVGSRQFVPVILTGDPEEMREATEQLDMTLAAIRAIDQVP